MYLMDVLFAADDAMMLAGNLAALSDITYTLLVHGRSGMNSSGGAEKKRFTHRCPL
jgi:hypothetical protein